MNKNIGFALAVIAILLGSWCLRLNTKINRMEQAQRIEKAKEQFLNTSLNIDAVTKNNVYDSVYAANDTVRFFKNGLLVGSSVTQIH
jgi:AraC-like DNA-binding protein